jgi:hypothetical protein
MGKYSQENQDYEEYQLIKIENRKIHFSNYFNLRIVSSSGVTDFVATPGTTC